MGKTRISVVCGWIAVAMAVGGCSKMEVQRSTEQKWLPVSDLVAELLKAEELIQQDKPKKAQKRLKKLVKKYPDSELMDRAMMLQADALFARGLYYQAFVEYDELVDKYPASRFFEPAIRQEVEIARRFLAGAKRKVWGFISASAKTEAVAILENVEEKWPGSALAAQALMMQADYYFQQGRYLEAQTIYQIVVDNYSRSSQYRTAMLKNAQATHAQYIGPSYESGCLTDAQIRYQQYLLQSARDSERKELTDRLDEIDRQQAEKEFQIADFYRRTGESAAAEHYWGYVAEQWPHTDWGHQAEELLAQSQSQ